MAAPLDLFGSRFIPPEISELVFIFAGPKALTNLMCTCRANFDAYRHVARSLAKRAQWVCRVDSPGTTLFAETQQLPCLRIIHHYVRPREFPCAVFTWEWLKVLRIHTGRKVEFTSLPPRLELLTVCRTGCLAMPPLPGFLKSLTWSEARLVLEHGHDGETRRFMGAFPRSLTELTCDFAGSGYLELPDLPPFLERLDISNSRLRTRTLPEIPATLKHLRCAQCNLTHFPNSLSESSLLFMDCQGNQITALPPLPLRLTYLDCSENELVILPALLPAQLTLLSCGNNQITALPPAIPLNLRSLGVEDNPLTTGTLPPLPDTLLSLNCCSANLTSLPALPAMLETLYCNDNDLRTLPPLPPSLTCLCCWENQLTALPEPLPKLYTLSCASNDLRGLPALPETLCGLDCSDQDSGMLDGLPELPAQLVSLRCRNVGLVSLPALPVSLFELYCDENSLQSLPRLPDSLQKLHCAYNRIKSLPALPKSLRKLACGKNRLKSLPPLPKRLKTKLLW